MRLHGLVSLFVKIPYLLNSRLIATTYTYSYTNSVFKRSITLLNCVNQQQWGKNKKHRNVQLNLYFDSMADPKIEATLAPLRANVKEQVILRLELHLADAMSQVFFINQRFNTSFS